jgi:hypothetical protein
MKPISDGGKVSASRIKGILRRLGHCELDTLCAECTDFTWNQVFMEIDRMSRTGEVLLKRRGSDTYVVSLPLLREHDETSSHS